MNPSFLQEYASHHLHDINEYSEESLNRFVSECSDFLAVIKDADRNLWEEVMTMSSPKKSMLMKNILEDRQCVILPHTQEQQIKELEEFVGFSITEPLSEELKLEMCEELGWEMADFDDLEGGDQSVDESAFAIGTAVAAVGSVAAAYAVFKILKKHIRSMDDLMSDRKTKEASNIIQYLRVAIGVIGFGIGVASASLLGWLWVGFWILYMLVALRSMAIGSNLVLTIVTVVKSMLFNIFKFVRSKNRNVSFSKKYMAMYTLERSQLQGCITSCQLNNEGELERFHVISLALMEVSKRDTNPTAVDAKRYLKADCLHSCCMRYMVSMIAELFGALKSCMQNTMNVNLRVRGDAMNEIRAINLNPVCESIRTELNVIFANFEMFLELAFKGNNKELHRWRQALNQQIMHVMNGQHSKPVSVGYASTVTSSPIVFEF